MRLTEASKELILAHELRFLKAMPSYLVLFVSHSYILIFHITFSITGLVADVDNAIHYV